MLAAALAFAHEPDGRVAFRYMWLPPDQPGGARIVRLIVTPVVPVADADLSAVVPKDANVSIRSTAVAGTHERVAIVGLWPSGGLPLGALAAGQSVTIDLEIVLPETGGGVLSLALAARADGRAIQEGVGIVLGYPGTEPVLRHDAAEFPAEGGRAR